ncbi:MAG TPA: hypothetical protein VM033_04210 [Gemmatimonadaceae bacterium]|nr:hypothetical protein [Gemmatimonadaceae bacterium]
MKDPNDLSKQPKDPVADALTDRNADPDAHAEPQDASLKVHGDALLQGKRPSPPEGEQADGAQRDEGF